MEEPVHHPVVPEFVCEYHAPLWGPNGLPYKARLYGIAQGVGVWDGWLIFFPERGGPLLRTDRQVEQASLEDLAVWGRGVTPPVLEEAIAHAHPFREAGRTAEAHVPAP